MRDARHMLLCALVALAACGDAASSTSCKVGDQMPCTCPNGDQAVKLCLETGDGYSSCIGCSGAVPPLSVDMRRPVTPSDDGGTPDAAGTAGKPMACSATNCTGCCKNGNCVLAAEQTDDTCHVGSLTVCQMCPIGFSCIADQACAKTAPSCDATSCPDGCCDGNVCLAAGPKHCGKAGGTCNTCATGSLCTDGSCQNDVDPDAVFYVTIQSVEVLSTDADGVPWDTTPVSSPPDPKVCFYDGSGHLACTKECSDMYSCNFSPADGVLSDGMNSEGDDALGVAWPFFGSELMSGLPFRVWDMDYAPLHRYDTIASGTMFKITKLQTSYAILPFQQVQSLTFTLQAQ
jgi:hypothetical protein